MLQHVKKLKSTSHLGFFYVLNVYSFFIFYNFIIFFVCFGVLKLGWCFFY
jgi:hypothetical protein